MLENTIQLEVKVAGEPVGRIAQGILVFLGIARDDGPACADYLVKKITELRIFDDAQGKMNVSA